MDRMNLEFKLNTKIMTTYIQLHKIAFVTLQKSSTDVVVTKDPYKDICNPIQIFTVKVAE